MLEIGELNLVIGILEQKSEELDRLGEFDERRRVEAVRKKLAALAEVKEAFRLALLPKEAEK